MHYVLQGPAHNHPHVGAMHFFSGHQDLTAILILQNKNMRQPILVQFLLILVDFPPYKN
jgi:hypothetical protein